MTSTPDSRPKARGPRLTAEERRELVIVAAMHEFARGGYAGTSTETIARRAGVSQPYLFQLFGTKRELFLAAARRCFDRTRTTFETAGRAARAERDEPHHILDAMGVAYARLLHDREALQLQLHAYAACDDPVIRDVVRAEYATLARSVADVSGASGADLATWFAAGMLMNVGAAVGVERLDELVPGATFDQPKEGHAG